MDKLDKEYQFLLKRIDNLTSNKYCLNSADDLIYNVLWWNCVVERSRETYSIVSDDKYTYPNYNNNVVGFRKKHLIIRRAKKKRRIYEGE